MANSLMQLVPEIYPIYVEDMRRAVGLFQTYALKGLTPRGVQQILLRLLHPPRDVLHASVMMNRGLKEILPTDSQFDLIAWITRVDPEDLSLQRKSDKQLL